MSRYLRSRLRLVRKLGVLPNLTLKKSNRFSQLDKQNSGIKKISEFCVRLKEKQKIKFNYGVTERQILNYLKRAKRKKGSTGIEFLNFLEMRLDNILFRSGFFPTILFARQFVSHGHILVNNNLVTIPSFFCKPSYVIRVNNSESLSKIISNNLKLVRFSYFALTSYINVNSNDFSIKILNFLTKKSSILIINELLVIEFYSKKL